MHLPLCAVTGHLQPAKVTSALSLVGEQVIAVPSLAWPTPSLDQRGQFSIPSVRAQRSDGPGGAGEMLTQAGQGPQEVEEGQARRMSPYGFFLADSKALNPHLQGSQAGGRVGIQAGLTHLRNASWLLRKGKNEGSQTSPWSRQASVQALPGAASQARREWVGGQAPGTELTFWAHSR